MYKHKSIVTKFEFLSVQGSGPIVCAHPITEIGYVMGQLYYSCGLHYTMVVDIQWGLALQAEDLDWFNSPLHVLLFVTVPFPLERFRFSSLKTSLRTVESQSNI